MRGYPSQLDVSSLSSVYFLLGSPAQTAKIFSGSMCESDESRRQSPSILWVSLITRTKPITQRQQLKVDNSAPLFPGSFLVGTPNPISPRSVIWTSPFAKIPEPRNEIATLSRGIEWGLGVSATTRLNQPPWSFHWHPTSKWVSNYLPRLSLTAPNTVVMITFMQFLK